MVKKLGICVVTRKNMSHVIGLAKASHRAGKHTDIFFTGEGVHLTQEENFSELLEAARVGICEVSYIANGYKGKAVPGLVDKDFVTQIRNAEMVESCDRYLIL